MDGLKNITLGETALLNDDQTAGMVLSDERVTVASKAAAIVLGREATLLGNRITIGSALGTTVLGPLVVDELVFAKDIKHVVGPAEMLARIAEKFRPGK